MGDRRRGGARLLGVLLASGRRSGFATAARWPDRGRHTPRPDHETRRDRGRSDPRAAPLPKFRRRVHGGYQGWAFRHHGRAGTGMAPPARKSQREAQFGCPRAMDERHGRDAASGGQVDRRFRLKHGPRGGGALRSALSARAGTRLSDAAEEPPRVLPHVLVAARRAETGHVEGARRAVALHRNADRGQAPPVRLARRPCLPGPSVDCHRPRRRRDVRYPAQSLPTRRGRCGSEPAWKTGRATPRPPRSRPSRSPRGYRPTSLP